MAMCKPVMMKSHLLTFNIQLTVLKEIYSVGVFYVSGCKFNFKKLTVREFVIMCPYWFTWWLSPGLHALFFARPGQVCLVVRQADPVVRQVGPVRCSPSRRICSPSWPSCLPSWPSCSQSWPNCSQSSPSFSSFPTFPCFPNLANFPQFPMKN